MAGLKKQSVDNTSINHQLSEVLQADNRLPASLYLALVYCRELRTLLLEGNQLTALPCQLGTWIYLNYSNCAIING